MITEKQLNRIYELSKKQEKERMSMFELLLSEYNKYEETKLIKQRRILSNFFTYINLQLLKKNKKLRNKYIKLISKEKNLNEIQMSFIERYAILKDNTLITVLEKNNFKKKEIEVFKRLTYKFVSKQYMKEFKKLLKKIKKDKLFSKEDSNTLLILLEEWLKISKEMNKLHILWENKVLLDINKKLDKKFKTISEGIEYLRKNNLIEKGHNNKEADRTYSTLIKSLLDEEYKIISYKEAFPNEIYKITNMLKNITKKMLEEKNLSEEKRNWLNYLEALIVAFNEIEVNELVTKWAIVDEKWMKIKGPLQPGHFFEYYEDKYRKSVAIEWDLRIDNLSNKLKNVRKDIIETRFKEIFYKLNNNEEEYTNVYKEVMNNLEKVQVHIGKPLFYSGSQFNGLASAQVIPNDEIVSEKYGKKIFAYHEKGLEIAKNKPFLKMSTEIFGKEIVEIGRKNIFKYPERDLKIYDILTIGHEYGHILWKATDTEILMNKTGEFKNLEEFKATTGGIVAFFDSEEENEYWKEVYADIIKRAVSLISWKGVEEVEPYYVESLIMLEILFQSNVLEYKEKEDIKLKINFTKNTYENFKENLRVKYIELANHYINKKDAKEYLDKFVKKEDKEYLPLTESIKKFVKWYYKYYQKNSTIIDTEIKKEDYIYNN